MRTAALASVHVQLVFVVLICSVTNYSIFKKFVITQNMLLCHLNFFSEWTQVIDLSLEPSASLYQRNQCDCLQISRKPVVRGQLCERPNNGHNKRQSSEKVNFIKKISFSIVSEYVGLWGQVILTSCSWILGRSTSVLKPLSWNCSDAVASCWTGGFTCTVHLGASALPGQMFLWHRQLVVNWTHRSSWCLFSITV